MNFVSSTTRFEKLDITPKSAHKIKPVLERWMKEAEERYGTLATLNETLCTNTIPSAAVTGIDTKATRTT